MKPAATSLRGGQFQVRGRLLTILSIVQTNDCRSPFSSSLVLAAAVLKPRLPRLVFSWLDWKLMTKVVTQLFGERMVMANSSGCSSVWGKLAFTWDTDASNPFHPLAIQSSVDCQARATPAVPSPRPQVDAVLHGNAQTSKTPLNSRGCRFLLVHHDILIMTPAISYYDHLLLSYGMAEGTSHRRMHLKKRVVDALLANNQGISCVKRIVIDWCESFINIMYNCRDMRFFFRSCCLHPRRDSPSLWGCWTPLQLVSQLAQWWRILPYRMLYCDFGRFKTSYASTYLIGKSPPDLPWRLYWQGPWWIPRRLHTFFWLSLSNRNREDDVTLIAQAGSNRDLWIKPSHWAAGGDGWAYDIGFSGIDHVLHGWVLVVPRSGWLFQFPRRECPCYGQHGLHEHRRSGMHFTIQETLTNKVSKASTRGMSVAMADSGKDTHRKVGAIVTLITFVLCYDVFIGSCCDVSSFSKCLHLLSRYW